jgi:hypothetical protein
MSSSDVICVEDMVGSHGRLWALGTIGLGLLLGNGAAPARPEQGPTQLAGRDWQGFGPKEKDAYVAGFIAGAAVRGTISESSVDTTPSKAIEVMRSAKQLPFPYAVSVYASQIDDYYWWENHLDVPIVDVLARTNFQLRSH